MHFSHVLVLAACFQLHQGDAHQGEENAKHYTNEWVVRLEGGPQVAQLLAVQMGYTYKGPVRGFPDTYRMVKDDHPTVNKRSQPTLTQRFTTDTRVMWADQQFAKDRSKRGIIPLPDREFLESSGTRSLLKRSKRADLEVPSRGSRFLFNDELWDQQWYLQDTRTRYDLPKLDLHVLPVYARGITGRGIRVSVLDDGIEGMHDDLRENYDPEISYDVNDEDYDPTPRYDAGSTNQHGTRCAGEIAMVANNGKCGVGVAFKAKIGGVRLLDGLVDDRSEGVALSYAHDKVDIYSVSWGPTDNGETLEGPGRMVSEAFQVAIEKGRGGKGVIYVWASGNGGMKGDNCNCDGYVASVYTLAIGSASQQGHFPWYGEQCAPTLATAYSSGAYTDQMIATTDLKNKCTVRHSGTSAAAPLAAGIVALALEVNPELTWRDVQHLVMWTSEWAPLKDNEGWQRNAVGYWVSTRFGFGLMNADGLVSAASNWTTVPPKTICTVDAMPLKDTAFVKGVPITVKIKSNNCRGTKDELRYLEHVEVLSNIEYPVRGALEVALTSPQGTKINLLSPRNRDNSSAGFVDWKFMSVLTWGEDPEGVWEVEIQDKQEVGTDYTGSVGHFQLILHGTMEKPAYLAHGPRQYDEDYNRIHRKTAEEEDFSNFIMADRSILDSLKFLRDMNYEDWKKYPDRYPGVPVSDLGKLAAAQQYFDQLLGVDMYNDLK